MEYPGFDVLLCEQRKKSLSLTGLKKLFFSSVTPPQALIPSSTPQPFLFWDPERLGTRIATGWFQQKGGTYKGCFTIARHGQGKKERRTHGLSIKGMSNDSGLASL
jgi:hypothetical protein